jgi:GTPase SAR1 family protein
VITIQRRAERQELEEKLTKSFVPTSVIDELQTNQNQLIFGRRGVGKTHTLKVFLGQKVQEGYLATYIDCTSFGSGLASDGSSVNVGIRFFSKLIYGIANALMDHVVRMELPAKVLACPHSWYHPL